MSAVVGDGMKRGLKMMSLLMLCFLMAVIFGAASDYTLGIYGNANMDDRIDEQGIAFVNDIISGAESATNLTDANEDGNIDERDIDQIEQIIGGKERELTILDSAGRTWTVQSWRSIAWSTLPTASICSISVLRCRRCWM